MYVCTCGVLYVFVEQVYAVLLVIWSILFFQALAEEKAISERNARGA